MTFQVVAPPVFESSSTRFVPSVPVMVKTPPEEVAKVVASPNLTFLVIPEAFRNETL